MRAITSLILLSLCAFSYAFPASSIQETEEFITEDLTPSLNDLVNQLHTFTPQDLAYLKGLYSKKDSFTSDDEVLTKIKTEQPELYKKAVKLVKPFVAKIERLSPEARAFFMRISQMGESMMVGKEEPALEELMTMGMKMIHEYDQLPAAAKSSIKENLPIIDQAITMAKNASAMMGNLLE